MYRRDQEFLKEALVLSRDLFYAPGFRAFVLLLVGVVGIVAIMMVSMRISQEKFENRIIENQNRLNTEVDNMYQVVNLIKHDILGDYTSAIPENVYFLDKPIPLEHYSAKQNLNWALRHLMADKPGVVDALRRFHDYKDAFLDSLRSYNLHSDLIYVALAESWACYFAVSTAGAVGVFQFMPYTAIEMGVEVSNEVDMRRDPWYMIKIFCKYIKKLIDETGSYEGALRAYNTGLRRFLNAAATQNWVTNLWFLNINNENNMYLYYVAAWKLVEENPEKFGIAVDYNFPPLNFTKITIRFNYWEKRYLSFRELAELTECYEEILEDLNPAYIKIEAGERLIPGLKGGRYIDRKFRLPPWAKVDNLKYAKIKGVQFVLN